MIYWYLIISEECLFCFVYFSCRNLNILCPQYRQAKPNDTSILQSNWNNIVLHENTIVFVWIVSSLLDLSVDLIATRELRDAYL